MQVKIKIKENNPSRPAILILKKEIKKMNKLIKELIQKQDEELFKLLS